MLNLSPAQSRVVAHRGTDLQVIACAGSGKTEAMARRVATLLSEGVPPASIVAFTFTERAATELKERIVRRVTEAEGPAFRDRISPLYVGTIHAYCFQLLQDHVPRYGNYDVLDENRHAGFLAREFRAIGLDKLARRKWQPIRDFARTVDVMGNEGIHPEALGDTQLAACYRAWVDRLDRFHFLTFSRLISAAIEALETPAIAARIRAPLRHLLVDEYQDVNPAQERLITLLAQDPVQLCVVGDDDQSIYQWRGSDVKNIVGFTTRRPGAHTETLATNRRSRAPIVAAAAEFAETISGRLPKAMEAARPAAEAELTGWIADTDADEAEALAAHIQRMHTHGFRYRDIAVLFRSVRTASPPLLQVFDRLGIPYTCGGRTGLFLVPEISLFAEAFAWLVGGDWQDERYGDWRPANLDQVVAGLSRIFNAGTEVVGLRKWLEDWRAFRLRGIRPVSLVGDYYALLGLLRAWDVDADTPCGAARLGVLARFSEVLGDFEHIYRRGRLDPPSAPGGRHTFVGGHDRGKPYFQALYSYLVYWARDAYEEFAGEAHPDLDAVDVLTVHQAKGLEWPVVFLPSLVNGRFPSARAGQAQDWLLPLNVFPAAVRARYEGSDGEERRLFYVALTRARDAAYLSCFKKRTRRFEPSPYLREVLGNTLIEGGLPLPPSPEAVPTADPAPVRVSFSDLARVAECGHSWRLGTIFGFQSELSPELGYGKAIHHVLRQLAESARASGRIPDQAEVDALIDAETYVPFAAAATHQTMRRAAARVVAGYVQEFSDDLARIHAVERPFTLHVHGGEVSGRADVVLGTAGSAIDIVDYKVANDPKREALYRLQLAVYAASACGEGLPVAGAWLHELRDGVRHPVDVGPAVLDAAVREVSRLVERVREGRLPPEPMPDRCDGCDYWKVCRHRACPDGE